jgi:uncharacterized membrane protein YcgQ (UPF0703/DUF1980 family)
MMKRILSVLPSFVLLALGIFLFYLIGSGNYEHFLHPRFMWLSGIAGALLTVAGLITLKGGLKLSLSTVIIVTIFTVMCLVAPSVKMHGAENHSGRVVMNGIEYIPINIAELYMQLYNSPPKVLKTIMESNHYLFQGYIYKNDQLGKVGNFAVVRAVMSCCIADACTYGFRIQSRDSGLYTNDECVKIYGHMVKFKPDGLERTIDYPMVANSDIKDDIQFVPEKIEPEQEPNHPFIVRWENKEPFAY